MSNINNNNSVSKTLKDFREGEWFLARVRGTNEVRLACLLIIQGVPHTSEMTVNAGKKGINIRGMEGALFIGRKPLSSFYELISDMNMKSTSAIWPTYSDFKELSKYRKTILDIKKNIR